MGGFGLVFTLRGSDYRYTSDFWCLFLSAVEAEMSLTCMFSSLVVVVVVVSPWFGWTFVIEGFQLVNGVEDMSFRKWNLESLASL